MSKPRLLHLPYDPFAYARADGVARLVLRAEQRRVRSVRVHYGDRYEPTTTDCVPMQQVTRFAELAAYAVDVSVPTRRLKYTFEVESSDGSRWFFGEQGVESTRRPENVFQLAYLTRRDLYEVPAWAESAVCYQIFPDRFKRHDGAGDPVAGGALTPWTARPTAENRFGGTLHGIREQLPYLDDLGINLIYLTPIFQAESNHKYDTTDYLEIDPSFGTKQDLKDLVDAAHERGMRIVLDAVFNHSGFEFAPFRDCRMNGRKSPYWDWFFIEGDEVDAENVNYETFATKLRYMPKLNVANSDTETYLLDVAAYWVREFNIDGWRLDVANEIDHVFWRKFRQTVKTVKSDALIIGEVWHNALPWLRGDMFDGVMNYPFREATHAFLLQQRLSAEGYAAQLEEIFLLYPAQANEAGFNLLGSHDTPRLLTCADASVERALLAFVLQFAMPGIPMLYYGDEVGMEGGADPDCRAGMIWPEDQQNQRLRTAVTKLAHLRRSEPALAGDSLQVVLAEQGVVVLERRVTGHVSSDTVGRATGHAAVRVAVNAGSEPYQFTQTQSGTVLFATGSGFEGGSSKVITQLSPQSAIIWRCDGAGIVEATASSDTDTTR